MKLQLIIAILLFASCNTSKKSKDIIDESKSENSLDWVGIYEGTLPCADCFGMQTKLVLKKDKTFLLRTVYKGKSDELIEKSGSFQWNDSKNGITLHMDGKPSLDHQYLVKENQLLKLDRKGNKISGDLKDKYKLTKNTSNSYNLKPNEHIYWINSQKVKCTGVAPMMCMQIQKSKTVVANNWKLFYDNIKGFNFEQGYLYKLIVREIKKPENEVPADASSINYELVEIIEKAIDNKLRLHDIWALESIKGNKINQKEFKKNPQIEINLTDNRVLGNDGCNNFTGDINTLDSKQLKFGMLAGTKMACKNMKLTDEISKSLNEIQLYKLDELHLTLYNSNKKELLKYKKVD